MFTAMPLLTTKLNTHARTIYTYSKRWRLAVQFNRVSSGLSLCLFKRPISHFHWSELQWWRWWCQLEPRRAKLQSRHYQHTNTQTFFTGCIPSCRPNNSIRALKATKLHTLHYLHSSTHYHSSTQTFKDIITVTINTKRKIQRNK